MIFPKTKNLHAYPTRVKKEVSAVINALMQEGFHLAALRSASSESLYQYFYGVIITMSAMEPLCSLIGINPNKLSKEENILIEADLFLRLCEELKEIFREANKDYFRLLKLTKDKESIMLESKFMSFIIADILSTKNYNLEGIARYTDTHEDVIKEAYAGLNLYPSAILLRKSIELHRTVRRDLYRKIMKKIALEYLSVA